MRRSGRAVEADDVDRQCVERRADRADVRAEQHASRDVQSRLRLDRNAAQSAPELAHDPRDRRLHLQEILARLDQQEIDAAFNQRARLFAIERRELVEGDARERGIGRRDEHPRRSERAGDKTRTLWRRERVRGLARDLGGAAIDLDRTVAEAELVELHARSGKRIGFEDVRAGLEIGAVDRFDHVRPEEHQTLVAPERSLSAEIGRAELERHQFGAHRSVEDQDALVERREVRVHEPFLPRSRLFVVAVRVQLHGKCLDLDKIARHGR